MDRLGETFTQQDHQQLRYTPHKYLVYPQTNYFVILETDHAALNERGQQLMKVVGLKCT